MRVVIGESIPLFLKVFDRDETLTVKAILRDQDGKHLETVDLVSSGGGAYRNTSVKMPDVEYVTADYITNMLEKYEEPQDLFKSIPKPELEEKILVGEVVCVLKLDDEILVGVVE